MDDSVQIDLDNVDDAWLRCDMLEVAAMTEAQVAALSAVIRAENAQGDAWTWDDVGGLAPGVLPPYVVVWPSGDEGGHFMLVHFDREGRVGFLHSTSIEDVPKVYHEVPPEGIQLLMRKEWDSFAAAALSRVDTL